MVTSERALTHLVHHAMGIIPVGMSGGFTGTMENPIKKKNIYL